MQIFKSIVKIFIFFCPFYSVAQTTYLPEGNKIYHFMDRMEIKNQVNTDINFTDIKPFNRKSVVAEAMLLNNSKTMLSKVDAYNLSSIYMNNNEWYSGNQDNFKSKKPILKNFYKTKENFYEVNNKDIYLSVNPIISFQFGKEQNFAKKLYINSRGITVRGRIANKIGFSSTITDNQERGPVFFQHYVYRGGRDIVIPGAGFVKSFKSDTTAFDYFDARGYFTASATKYIDIQFGYDKNFIGDGYRSLFLSDWGNSNLFLKLNTKIWKFNYQNLFMELMPQFKKSGDVLLVRKYAAMHHLTFDISKSATIGIFEGIIFGRKDRFDFQYLNPIIFLRHVEGTVGSPDNAVAGFNFKANALHRFQFYGQFLLDEFNLKEVVKGKGYWANKWGAQLGAKYIDAFGIPNLDLQLETNRVRPYTYTHFDSIGNYTHYNQPLAHPLGANFQEFIGIAKYQPAPKWYITGRAIFYNQGLDSTGYNAGSDIFRSYEDRYHIDNGYKVGGGKKVICLNSELLVSYEFRENLFFDLSFLFRKYKLANTNTNTSMISAGVRLNIFKREYNF